MINAIRLTRLENDATDADAPGTPGQADPSDQHAPIPAEATSFIAPTLERTRRATQHKTF